MCWTLAAGTGKEVLARAAKLEAAGRFVEVRLDYLADPGESAALIGRLRRGRASVLATLRSAAAGGRFQGSLDEQLRILAEAGEAGAEIVDVEVETAERAGAPALRRIRRAAALMISFHDFQGTPEALPAVLGRLRVFPADYYKIVPASVSHRDNAAILGLYGQGARAGRAKSAKPGKAKLIAFGMGEVGMPTRVLSLARGAPFAYVAFAAEHAVAPSQLTGAELRGQYRAGQLSARTAVYGVIGNPVSHSISPAVHNAAFAASRRDAVYLPFRVESFEDFLDALPAYGLGGFSVTLPHKEAMARSADWLEEAARDAGAVNTIVIRGGKLCGYNTDMAGITVPLEKCLTLRGRRVLVAGTGGAARGAAFALARAGARVAVVGRRPEQAAALADLVGGEHIEHNDLSDQRFDAIVHATPLGMAPDAGSCFFSPGELNAPLLFETVYTPAETKLMRMARRRGMKVIPGLEMFLEQAVLQFELWTGRRAPRAAMERAAKKALKGHDE